MKLVKNYRTTKRKKFQKRGDKEDGAVRGVSELQEKNYNSSLFSASFCNGAVESSILADSCADSKLLTKEIANNILSSNPSVQIQDLPQSKLFGTAKLGSERIRCNKKILADVELRIRHAEKLVLRRVEWLIRKDNLEHGRIGRHLLKALGMDNRVLLSAARERHGNSIDTAQLEVDEEISNGSQLKINSLLEQRSISWKSTFHSDTIDEDDGMDE